MMTDAHWQFIYENEKADLTKLLLSQHLHPEIDMTWAVRQIEARQKAEKKLPSWYKTNYIEFPIRLSVEQSSSEATAKFKAGLCKGNSMIDLTGGFGVDAFCFAQTFKQVTYCEQTLDLAEIVEKNRKIFGYKNIEILQGDGLEVLGSNSKRYDLIYLDPARRDTNQRKVVLLDQYQPNVLEHLELFFEKAEAVLLKVSPMLDITLAIQKLQKVQQVWVVAVGNEVKELLFLLNEKAQEQVRLTAVVLEADNSFEFSCQQDALKTDLDLAMPQKYLYEPHPALLKAALQDAFASKLQLKKIHPHSHLYTSGTHIKDFCGRAFQIESIFSLNKKEMKKHLKAEKANITVRNFPLTVAAIRKKTGLKEGGDIYLFATTLKNEQKVLVKCRKIV